MLEPSEQLDSHAGTLTRVALIAHYGEDNYGNHLVNFATRRVLERCGCQVDVIVFTGGHLSRLVGSAVRLPRRLIRLHSTRMLLRRSLGRVGRAWSGLLPRREATKGGPTVRLSRFRDFGSRHIRPTFVPVAARRRLASEYEKFVVGSDQIWNYDHKLGPWLFLDFVDPGKRACLAPSVGHSDIPPEWVGSYRRWLRGFGEISVREENWVEGFRALAATARVSLLPDPTLMLSAADWDEVAAPSTADRPYLLVYDLGGLSQAANQFAVSLAQRRHLQIRRLSARWPEEDWASGPSEFIALVRGASAVVTDSYHGSVFSFLFDRPLVIVPREGAAAGMNSRIETLASCLHLEDRLLARQSLDTVMEHDYSQGLSELPALQKATWSYLARCGFEAPEMPVWTVA